MNKFARLDRKCVWHPFTQMRDWLKREPVVIASGRGAVLRDVKGREYLDANSSIWTNLHGHGHPKINSALNRQLKKIAHSSALGFANEPASLLAQTLVEAGNEICDLRFAIYDPKHKPARKSHIVNRKLEKVFFSDDGSTAMEVALKLAYEFTPPHPQQAGGARVLASRAAEISVARRRVSWRHHRRGFRRPY